MAAKMMQRAKNVERRIERSIDEKSKLLRDIESIEEIKLFPQKFHLPGLMRVEDLSIYYDGRKIHNPVTFEVNQGDRIFIRGENGAGKSSIIKLLLGEWMDYQGKIWIGNQLNISYVPQDTSNLRGTIRDFAISRGIEVSVLYMLLSKLDIGEELFGQDIQNFSEGQRKKVLIAGSLCEKAHLYIWDEPLNYIDVWSRMQIEKLLVLYKPTIICIEHDQAFAEVIGTKEVHLSL